MVEEGVTGDAVTTLDPDHKHEVVDVLNRLDLAMATIDEIAERLGPLIVGHQVAYSRCRVGSQLFRGRLMTTRPRYLSEMSYPPAEVTPLGRCNRAGSPRLYCCSAREAVFFEINPTVGSTVCVVEWATTSPMLVNHAGYTAETFRAFSREIGPEIKSRIDAIPAGTETVATLLGGLLTATVPRGEEHRYKITAAIASVMSDAEIFDAFMYPSVAMTAFADNLAIKPSFSDNNLAFVRAEFARVENVGDHLFEVRVVDSASQVEADGGIRWIGYNDRRMLRNDEDHIDISRENGTWVARDPWGNIIGRHET